MPLKLDCEVLSRALYLDFLYPLATNKYINRKDGTVSEISQEEQREDKHAFFQCQ